MSENADNKIEQQYLGTIHSFYLTQNFNGQAQTLLQIKKVLQAWPLHPRLYFAWPFLTFGANGAPLSFPRNFISNALSILAKTALFGTAFPASYSLTTCGFSHIFVAKS